MSRTEHDPIIGINREILSRLGIKGVLYDLDDTLIYTSEVFLGCMNGYVDAVVEETGIGRETLYGALSEINDEEYKKMGVNPLRWSAVVERLEERFDDKTGTVRGKLDCLMDIYKTVPRMRPGVNCTLSAMRGMDMKQALITHANEEWTNWKMDQLGLWDWFEAVLIADENGHKKIEHWSKGMELLGLQPSECLVVGDNLNGDIVPAAALGARTVWMPSPWSVYRDGVVPEGTIQIGEFDEFISVLRDLR